MSQHIQICDILNIIKNNTKMKTKNYKNRTASVKYIRILNRRSSHYHNKLLLLRLNCRNCFRHFAYCYCNLCICKHQYKSEHLLNIHTFGCITCMNTLETPIPKFSFLMLKISNWLWNWVLINKNYTFLPNSLLFINCFVRK